MVLPRAFSVLRLLAGHQQGLGLSAVAVELDVPKSSLSSTLKALTDQGYLNRSGTLYSLGAETYALASLIVAGRNLRQVARPYLERTMEQTGETVLLSVLDADQAHCSYIDLVESIKPVRYAVPVGTRRPLYASSCGRLFLAYMPETLRRAYLDRVRLDPVTDKTITERQALEDLLSRIRRDGVSITLGDYSPDAAGFSAPVFNSDGEMVASLVVALPLSRGVREQDAFVDSVKRAAGAISKTLGYPGN